MEEAEYGETFIRCEKKEKYDSDEDKAFCDFVCYLLYFLGENTIAQSKIDKIKNAHNIAHFNGEMLALLTYYNLSLSSTTSLSKFIEKDKYGKNYEPVDIIRYNKIYNLIKET